MTATEFSPTASLIGGGMIGLSAAVMLVSVGRVTGISGFVSRLLPPYHDKLLSLRLAFVVGLLAAAPLYNLVTGALPDQVIEASSPLLLLAGLLTGLGTVVGSGCTSGHGVCGVARLSTRSLVATAVFMGVGVITVFIVRHVLGPL